jgi:RNA polymerase sigma factor (sigma-70 family)
VAVSRQNLVLYHFCRLQLPAVALPPEAFERHLHRAFAVYQAKVGAAARWEDYLSNLYPLDWFTASACLEGDPRAWQTLFAARTGRSDCLLVDALRARAVRLYPRDEERQENAVREFWSHLLVAETPGAVPVLARYDGQRPLVPWLIRVFQNWHISMLRQQAGWQALPDDDLALPLPESPDARWHDAFVQAARDWLAQVGDDDLLILGLRLRYRLSQREVAHLLGLHEGTISRQTTQIRDGCVEAIRQQLLRLGWTGDDLSQLILTEMGSVLLDEPRLSADRLAALLACRGKRMVRSEPVDAE